MFNTIMFKMFNMSGIMASNSNSRDRICRKGSSIEIFKFTCEIVWG